MDKNSLRIWAKKERLKLDIPTLSACIVKNLIKTEVYKKANNVLIFYPLKGEINLLSILEDSSKSFYLPKIDGENLLCCPYKDGDETCLSCFSTCEPLTESCDKKLIDLVVVPALACDKKGYRLGYGGGFYDRFLRDFKGIKISCIPSDLVIDTVYPESHDIKMDYVITEKG